MKSGDGLVCWGPRGEGRRARSRKWRRPSLRAGARGLRGGASPERCCGGGRWALRFGQRTRRRGDPRAGGKVRPPRGPAPRVSLSGSTRGVCARRKTRGCRWVRRVRRALVGPRSGPAFACGWGRTPGSRGSVRSAARPSRFFRSRRPRSLLSAPAVSVTRGSLPSCVLVAVGWLD